MPRVHTRTQRKSLQAAAAVCLTKLQVPVKLTKTSQEASNLHQSVSQRFTLQRACYLGLDPSPTDSVRHPCDPTDHSHAWGACTNPQGFQHPENFRGHFMKLLQIKQFILKNKTI